MANYVQEVIKVAAEADVPVIFWGRHGIGKTASIEGLAAEGWFVKTIVLSQYDPTTLGGYPYKEETEHGVVMKYAMPYWLYELHRAAQEGRRTLLFFDEGNRAEKLALKTALRAVQERYLGEHPIPEGCFISMACNPASDTDRVTVLSDPLMDRFAHVCVEPDLGDWIEWAKNEELPDSLLNWVQENPASRFAPLTMDGLFEEQVLARITPTPRSLHAVGRILKVVGEDKVHDNKAAVALIIGLLGREQGLNLIKHLKQMANRSFDGALIFRDNARAIKEANKLIEAGKSQTLISALDKIDSIRASSNEALAQEIAKLQGLDEADHKRACNDLADFLLALPRDIAVKYLTNKNGFLQRYLVQWGYTYLGKHIDNDKIQALLDIELKGRGIESIDNILKI